MNYRLTIVLLVTLVLLIGMSVAAARPTYFAAFKQKYNTDSTKLDSCNTCHTSGGGSPRNPYGIAFSESGRNFASIENFDSDNDGFTNLEEINALTFPGDPKDYLKGGPQDGPQTSSGTIANETKQQQTTEITDDGREDPSPEFPVNATTEVPKSPGFEAILAVLGFSIIKGLKRKDWS